jgi:hypothetical protein
MNNVVVQIKFGVGQKCFQFESAQDLRGSFSLGVGKTGECVVVF